MNNYRRKILNEKWRVQNSAEKTPNMHWDYKESKLYSEGKDRKRRVGDKAKSRINRESLIDEDIKRTGKLNNYMHGSTIPNSLNDLSKISNKLPPQGPNKRKSLRKIAKHRSGQKCWKRAMKKQTQDVADS